MCVKGGGGGGGEGGVEVCTDVRLIGNVTPVDNGDGGDAGAW